MGTAYEDFFTKCLGFRTKLVYVGDNTREVLGNVAPDKMQITKDSVEANPKTSSIAWSIYGIISGLLGYFIGSGTPAGTQESEEDKEYRLHFSDCAPLLVTSQVSLEEVNKARKAQDQELPLDMTKMRPNVVIGPAENGGGMTAFEEDFWAELAIRSTSSVEDGTDNDSSRLFLTANCGRCKSLNVDYKTGKQQPVSEQMLKRLADMKRRVDSGHGYSPIFGRYGFIARDSLDKTIEVGDAVEVARKNQTRTVFYWPGLSAGTKPKK